MIAAMLAAAAVSGSPSPDLRAAYCARLLTLKIEMAEALPDLANDMVLRAKLYGALRAGIAEMTARRDRLRNYVMPRAPYLDAAALFAAAGQADADMATVKRLAGQSHCDLSQVDICTRDLVPPDLKTAMSRCDDLSWLPY